jgi:hypothetical protein
MSLCESMVEETMGAALGRTASLVRVDYWMGIRKGPTRKILHCDEM